MFKLSNCFRLWISSCGGKMIVKGETIWRVGYSISQDEFFVFKIDSDDVVWAWGKDGLNCGLYEFLNQDSYIDLGEL